MARNHLGITDARRLEVPARHFPKHLLLAIILVSLAGFTLLGLSQTIWNNPTSGVNSLPNPQQVIPPVPTETPKATPTPTKTPTPTSLPTIEAKWTSIIPPGAIGTWGVTIEDDKGQLVYVFGDHSAHPQKVYVWVTKNGGLSWEGLGEIGGGPGDQGINPAKIGVNFQGRGYQRYLEDLSGGPQPAWQPKTAQNNNNIVVQPKLVPEEPIATLTWELLLSFDGGKSQHEVILPEEIRTGLIMFSVCYEIVFSEDSLKIFIAAGPRKIWQTDIPLNEIGLPK